MYCIQTISITTDKLSQHQYQEHLSKQQVAAGNSTVEPVMTDHPDENERPHTLLFITLIV